MIHTDERWEKIGRILSPTPQIWWMATHTGPSFALQISGSDYRIYLTGRDDQNRSTIGLAELNLNDPIGTIRVEQEAVFSPGERGTFDENGVSYPWLVPYEDGYYMYYVGWMPTVLTPFQNHTGLAKSNRQGRDFVRVSRAPILPRTDLEPYCSGSVCVLKENTWRLWYTSFQRWTSEAKPKHYYHIRYAESDNGIDWLRKGQVCIDFANSSEYAIGKPSVLRLNDTYHMWYVYRGDQYRIGYAHSKDGVNWERRDDLAGITVSANGWDSKAISYPHVFRHEDKLYMLYCGNEYGKEGLGLATLKIT
jgi:predicted GH43/DUF377 family glycosyl hydrolase